METERLILRRYKIDDLMDFYEYISNETVVQYEPYKPMTFAQAERELNNRIASDAFIAVELKDSHKMIGNIYLGKQEFNTLEIGFVFHHSYGKKGYATEACRSVIAESFERGIHRIIANCDPENKNSWGLLERLGFSNEGYMRQNVYFWMDTEGKPIWKDTMIYSLINIKDFQAEKIVF